MKYNELKLVLQGGPYFYNIQGTSANAIVRIASKIVAESTDSLMLNVYQLKCQNCLQFLQFKANVKV
jgi:hypothetical protein